MTSGEGAATLGAVAELVINLSIAQRSHLIYGPTHAVAARSAEKAAAALTRALALQTPVRIHFTPEAVFCGSHSLDRGHPIYRSFAERMWKLGIAGVCFNAGADTADLAALIAALGRAAREHVTRQRAEELLREAPLAGIEVQFLREMLTHAEREEIQTAPAGDTQRLWEDLIAQLAELGAPPAGPEETAPAPLLERGLHESSPDYAAAVIDYLKHLQRAEQQEAMLQETDFGKKISDLIAGVNPELRRQLATATVSAPETSPEALHQLVNLVGYDHIVESLQRLNAAGQSIPPTAFRTLSMLAMARREGTVIGPPSVPRPSEDPTAPGDAAAATQRSDEELQRLLDGLLSEEQANRYTSEEYERTLREAEQRARRMLVLRRPGESALSIARDEGERHFLLVSEQLLGDGAEPQMAMAVHRESQRAYLQLLPGCHVAGCREAMRLARAAGERLEVPSANGWIWESEEVLEQLRERLVEGSRWEAEASGEQLVDIGGPAVPLLIEVLTTSENLSVRRRVLAALEALAENPSKQLVRLLAPEQPWFVQRNAVYVLRRRGDASGCAAASALWRQAEPRVRLEILAYLLGVGDPEGPRRFEELLLDRDTELAVAAARAAMKNPIAETVAALLRRVEQVPPDQVGLPAHLGLLRALAVSRQPLALRYLAELPGRRRPLLPWQRERFRKQVAAMLADAS